MINNSDPLLKNSFLIFVRGIPLFSAGAGVLIVAKRFIPPEIMKQEITSIVPVLLAGATLGLTGGFAILLGYLFWLILMKICVGAPRVRFFLESNHQGADPYGPLGRLLEHLTNSIIRR